MSKTSDYLLRDTSKPHPRRALLVLEDGTAFAGTACGAEGEVFGEICFNTSMEGYLEIVTDPSYAGQIVTLTYPQVGNYGVHADDVQAQRPALSGLVVRDLCATPSSWRAQESLGAYLAREGVVAIEGVDTRALVRHIRDHGAQRAVISTDTGSIDELLAKVRESPELAGANLVARVSRDEEARFGAEDLPASHRFAVAAPACSRFHVVAYDCGIKRSILQGLARSGCAVTLVPWDTPADEVLARTPDGVFFSNGPGDPAAVSATSEAAAALLGKVPVFGICLGHQMVARAAGGAIEKLKFGHHGGNHPVANLLTGRVEVTAQNHGFCPRFQSLGALIPEESGGFATHEEDLRAWSARQVAPVVRNERFGRIRLTHVNLDDGTAEGFAFLDIPAFSVQYHPEAAPGPTDAHYLFTAFTRLMEGMPDYLDIDIAADRLAGWTFGGTEGKVA